MKTRIFALKLLFLTIASTSLAQTAKVANKFIRLLNEFLTGELANVAAVHEIAVPRT